MKQAVRFLPWIAVILWMALIFSFSMENSAQSSESSGRFIHTLLRTFRPGFSDLAYEEQHVVVESYDHFVRKAAHFTLYAVLGFLLCGALASSHSAFSIRNRLLTALLIGALYAVSDEIHQYFVPGRACMIRDMLLDSSGVLTGTLAMTALLLLLRRFSGKRSRS